MPSKLFALSLFVALAGCAQPSYAAGPLPKPARDLPPATGKATAVFAAGCFWCVEAVFEAVEGVTEVVSGYAGDVASNAKYDAVSAGRTRHAEAVRITYDPAKISYGRLLQVLFTTHDPTTLDRQGPDAGHQYRSAIFFATPAERDVAAAYVEQLTKAKSFAKPIVTTLEPLTEFFAAEEYHQDFVARHPDHGYVRAWVPGKMKKLLEGVPELVKKR
ncbi:peptide-methionine (S)-S-oxide reductase MsrA [Myxococcota bacterium]|nr:peptide-methionine (S)-S-oxide reductase MsrA [Myxococcota bacterium]